jgi:hypothetical protein
MIRLIANIAYFAVNDYHGFAPSSLRISTSMVFISIILILQSSSSWCVEVFTARFPSIAFWIHKFEQLFVLLSDPSISICITSADAQIWICRKLLLAAKPNISSVIFVSLTICKCWKRNKRKTNCTYCYLYDFHGCSHQIIT